MGSGLERGDCENLSALRHCPLCILIQGPLDVDQRSHYSSLQSGSIIPHMEGLQLPQLASCERRHTNTISNCYLRWEIPDKLVQVFSHRHWCVEECLWIGCFFIDPSIDSSQWLCYCVESRSIGYLLWLHLPQKYEYLHQQPSWGHIWHLLWVVHSVPDSITLMIFIRLNFLVINTASLLFFLKKNNYYILYTGDNNTLKLSFDEKDSSVIICFDFFMINLVK